MYVYLGLEKVPTQYISDTYTLWYFKYEKTYINVAGKGQRLLTSTGKVEEVESGRKQQPCIQNCSYIALLWYQLLASVVNLIQSVP